MLKSVRPRHLVTALILAMLSGVASGLVEYALTKGWPGLVSLAVAVAVGIVVLAILQSKEVLGSAKRPVSAQSETLPTYLETTLSSPHQTSNRVFSRRTPDELVNEIAGKTELAAKGIVQRHLGQWLRVNGSIYNVGEVMNEIRIPLELEKSEELAFLFFDAAVWHERVSSFNKGDQITAIGKIRSIFPHGVSLGECELLD